MKIGCIIQARTSSTRLPNKVLKELPYGSGITVLEQVIKRVEKSNFIDKIIIATTINHNDNKIVEIAQKNNVLYYRGSEDNVLSRYYGAAREHNLDYVVRITSDCPCIDYNVIDELIKFHLDKGNDYSSNTLSKSYPHGLDCEIFSFSILEQAYLKATEKYEIEHVTPYIYKSKKDSFNIGQLIASNEYNYPNIRITLDTIKDYSLLCTVYDYLYSENEFFNVQDIVDLFKSKPWLIDINADVNQKVVCSSLQEELIEVKKLLKRQDLNRALTYLDVEKGVLNEK